MIYKQGVLDVKTYPMVDTFGDLPEAADNGGEVYLVKTRTGTIFVDRRRAGLYRSDGASWKRLGEIVIAGATGPVAGFLPSNPPSGMCVVRNIYVDPLVERLKVKWEDTPVE